MPLVRSSELVGAAAVAGTAVAAFNAITIEHAQGIVAGAERAGLPVILQLSENAIAYHGGPRAIAAATVELASAASVGVALHLDHITDLPLVRLAPELGYSSVMYDGSRHDDAMNRTMTRQVVAWARGAGVWVEAELGEVGGKDGAHAPGVRTDPDAAARFVAETGVDALAVAVGSSHAMVQRTASLDLELVERLHAAVPVPLVLHGSSGVPDDALVAAAHRGMAKINIGTALNVAYTGAVRAHLAANLSTVDPRTYTSAAREAVAEVVAHYLRLTARAGEPARPRP